MSDRAEEENKKFSLSSVSGWEENKEGYFQNPLGQYLNGVYLNEQESYSQDDIISGAGLVTLSSKAQIEGIPTANYLHTLIDKEGYLCAIYDKGLFKKYAYIPMITPA